jgi:hypothetical protein
VNKIKDIVDTALESDSFKTLWNAVIAAGLVEVLRGSGPSLFLLQPRRCLLSCQPEQLKRY